METKEYTTNIYETNDTSISSAKKTAIIVILAIILIVALWFITNKLTLKMPYHQ